MAATQLGIAISSLALGWIGEPALARVIEPLLAGLLGDWAQTASHAIAIALAFAIITALHIVLGELAPKSLALQRSETTALWVVRPLSVFYFLFKPAILLLNGLGNQLLKLAGLRPGTGEESLHSPEELKMLVTASAEGGLLKEIQQEVVERVFNVGRRRISDFMTPRPDVKWIDTEDAHDEILRTIRECGHDQIVVGRGNVDDVIGVVRKQDILNQVLDGKALEPLALVQEALVLHERVPVLNVLEEFKKRPVRMAVLVNEYGSFEGIVTQTDLLEALAGEIPSAEDKEPRVLEREDGSLLMDGRMPIADAFDRLGLSEQPDGDDYHTLAGFALAQLRQIPNAGDHFIYEGWRFEIVNMDARRIDKLLVTKIE